MAHTTTAAGPRTWRHVGLPFLVLRVAGQAGEFAAFVVLTRQLSPGDFGRLSVAFLVARYLGLVADWGASVRGARDVARGDDPAAIHALVVRRTRVSWALAAAFALGALAFGRVAFVALAAVVLARGVNRDWLSLGRERGFASGASSLVQGVALVALTLFARSPAQAAAALAAGYLAGLVVSFVVNPHHKPAGHGDVRVDGWILGAVLADQVTISADTLLLAWLRTSSLAGVYAAVYRIPNAWMTLIGLTVFGAVASTAKRVAQGTHEDAKALQRRALGVGTKAAGVILLSAIPAYALVPIVFGDEYAPGRGPLVILLVATACMALAASMQPLYLAVARDRDVLTLAATGAVVNIAVNAVAIPLWGMTGAAIATLVAQLALLGILSWRLRKLLP
jgi:O-antigen/teichoic acid export membrane protein